MLLHHPCRRRGSQVDIFSVILWMSPLAIILWSLPATCQARSLGERAFAQLSVNAISSLVSSPDPVQNIDPFNPSSHLAHILIPRPPDTENNTIVKDYIVSTLKKLEWHVEEDTFNDTTPYGVKRFTNVIATKDPSAPRRVILSAHFDSKYFPNYPLDRVRFLSISHPSAKSYIVTIH